MRGDALAVEEVEVTFGTTRVLRAISLAVASGEFVALLGASGCGKTTLLRAISGFAPVRAGRVLLGGHEVEDRRPQQRGDEEEKSSRGVLMHRPTREKTQGPGDVGTVPASV